MSDHLSIAASIIALVGAVKSTVTYAKSVFNSVKEQEYLLLDLESLESCVSCLKNRSEGLADMKALRGAETLVLELHAFIIRFLEHDAKGCMSYKMLTMRYGEAIRRYRSLIRDVRDKLTLSTSVTTLTKQDSTFDELLKKRRNFETLLARQSGSFLDWAISLGAGALPLTTTHNLLVNILEGLNHHIWRDGPYMRMVLSWEIHGASLAYLVTVDLMLHPRKIRVHGSSSIATGSEHEAFTHDPVLLSDQFDELCYLLLSISSVPKLRRPAAYRKLYIELLSDIAEGYLPLQFGRRDDYIRKTSESQAEGVAIESNYTISGRLQCQ